MTDNFLIYNLFLSNRLYILFLRLFDSTNFYISDAISIFYALIPRWLRKISFSRSETFPRISLTKSIIFFACVQNLFYQALSPEWRAKEWRRMCWGVGRKFYKKMWFYHIFYVVFILQLSFLHINIANKNCRYRIFLPESIMQRSLSFLFNSNPALWKKHFQFY